MRLFVSIDLPPDIVAYVQQMQKEIQNLKLVEGRFTTAEQLHLTLRFCIVESEKYEAIDQALQTIIFKPCEVTCGTLGFFNHGNAVSIIWMDLMGDCIKKLAYEVDRVLAPIIGPADKPFVSHLTLARIKHVFDEQLLREKIAQFQVQPKKCVITELFLKESQLSEAGAKHIVRAKYYL